MTYQSEVNNGGHCQYFDNVENIGDLQKEISALEIILSDKHKNNLHLTYKAYLTLEEAWDNEQAEKTLEQCDAVFYENEEEINRILTAFATNIKL